MTGGRGGFTVDIRLPLVEGTVKRPERSILAPGDVLHAVACACVGLVLICTTLKRPNYKFIMLSNDGK